MAFYISGGKIAGRAVFRLSVGLLGALWVRSVARVRVPLAMPGGGGG